MNWEDTLEDFLEIVDSLDTNGFATVPPMEQDIEVQPIILQNNRPKLRIQTVITPISTPNVRTTVAVKDLVERIESLESLVAEQHMQLHELYSFINFRLEGVEKIVTKNIESGK